MELAVYFPNLKSLQNMDEALQHVDVSGINSSVSFAIMDNNSNYGDYLVNIQSLQWIYQLRNSGLDFSRLYFGQEFCQNLIPPPSEVEQAYYISRQLGWDFTYVTGGYLTKAGLDKVRRNLEKLREIGAEAEVVFNDWGTLRILQKEFPEFTRCMGRLLDKQTRLNLFTNREHPLPVMMDEIQIDEEQLRKNQIRAYADINLNNPEYMEALRDWGVTNVDLDIVPQGIMRPEDGWQVNMGVYFPWSFISTGRSCPTAATVDPKRGFVVTDEPCPRPCQKYNCSPAFREFKMSVLQRGPALFANNLVYAEPYFNGSMRCERIIYEPYIPV